MNNERYRPITWENFQRRLVRLHSLYFSPTPSGFRLGAMVFQTTHSCREKIGVKGLNRNAHSKTSWSRWSTNVELDRHLLVDTLFCGNHNITGYPGVWIQETSWHKYMLWTCKLPPVMKRHKTMIYHIHYWFKFQNRCLMQKVTSFTPSSVFAGSLRCETKAGPQMYWEWKGTPTPLLFIWILGNHRVRCSHNMLTLFDEGVRSRWGLTNTY